MFYPRSLVVVNSQFHFPFKGFICLSWGFSLLVMISQGYFTKGYMLDTRNVSCSFDYLSRDFNSRFWLFLMIILGYIVPNAVIAISYASLFYVVKKRRTSTLLFVSNKSRTTKEPTTMAFGFTQNQTNKISMSSCRSSVSRVSCTRKSLLEKSEKTLLKQILVQIIFFNLAWLPYVCLVNAAQIGEKKNLNRLVTPTTTLIANLLSKSFVLTINIYIAWLNFRSMSRARKTLILQKQTIIHGVSHQSALALR